MRNFPIVIVEDDKDDCDLIIQALNGVGATNEYRCFSSPVEALAYLRQTTETPFIIISDINLPNMNGLAFKKVINNDEELKSKRIPFVFLSSSAKPYIIDEAYHLSVQGFFQKPSGTATYMEVAQSIMQYWGNCKLPQAVCN